MLRSRLSFHLDRIETNEVLRFAAAMPGVERATVRKERPMPPPEAMGVEDEECVYWRCDAPWVGLAR
jgi:hypothetical protein